MKMAILLLQIGTCICACGTRQTQNIEEKQAKITNDSHKNRKDESKNHGCPTDAGSQTAESPDNGNVQELQAADSTALNSEYRVILKDESIVELGDDFKCLKGKCNAQLITKRHIKTSGIIGLRIKNISNTALDFPFDYQCEHVFFKIRGINEDEKIIGPAFGNIFQNRSVKPGRDFTIVTDIRNGIEKWLELAEGTYTVDICIGKPNSCLDKEVVIEYQRGDPVLKDFQDKQKRCEQLCPDTWPNRCAGFQ